MQNLHGHLNKYLIENRRKKLEDGTKIDWGLAEALAVGSLLYQGKKNLLIKAAINFLVITFQVTMFGLADRMLVEPLLLTGTQCWWTRNQTRFTFR